MLLQPLGDLDVPESLWHDDRVVAEAGFLSEATAAEPSTGKEDCASVTAVAGENSLPAREVVRHPPNRAEGPLDAAAVDAIEQMQWIKSPNPGGQRARRQ